MLHEFIYPDHGLKNLVNNCAVLSCSQYPPTGGLTDLVNSAICALQQTMEVDPSLSCKETVPLIRFQTALRLTKVLNLCPSGLQKERCHNQSDGRKHLDEHMQ
jgi:hypothetical protein